MISFLSLSLPSLSLLIPDSRSELSVGNNKSLRHLKVPSIREFRYLIYLNENLHLHDSGAEFRAVKASSSQNLASKHPTIVAVFLISLQPPLSAPVWEGYDASRRVSYGEYEHISRKCHG